MSQADAAREIGVPARTLWRWVHGKRRIGAPVAAFFQLLEKVSRGTVTNGL